MWRYECMWNWINFERKACWNELYYNTLYDTNQIDIVLDGGHLGRLGSTWASYIQRLGKAL